MNRIRTVLCLAVVLIASACAGATIEANQPADDSGPPEILANTAEDETTEPDVNAAAPEEAPDSVESDPTEPADTTAPELASDPDVVDTDTPPADQPAEPTGDETPATTAATATAETQAPTTVAPATTQASTVAPVEPTADGFLPPGSALPTDADCAARVNPAAAVRAGNATANQNAGGPKLSGSEFGRVTGKMTGSTDEILQWAACKWGLPADVARAQAATETWWRQGFLGDWTTVSADCAPGHAIGADGKPGECPQSIGLLQIKYKFFKEAFPGAEDSTAYSVDYAYAVWRNCFEGHQEWLNDSPKGKQYAAGDAWGCIGRWFAGEWHTPPATNYIAEVTERLDQRVWESADFISHG